MCTTVQIKKLYNFFLLRRQTHKILCSIKWDFTLEKQNEGYKYFTIAWLKSLHFNMIGLDL